MNDTLRSFSLNPVAAEILPEKTFMTIANPKTIMMHRQWRTRAIICDEIKNLVGLFLMHDFHTPYMASPEERTHIYFSTAHKIKTARLTDFPPIFVI